MATGTPGPGPQSYPPQPPESDTNIMGILGLVLGMFGFVTTITAPIGLVMSYMGLKHPKNGIAIAGLIVSIISTIYALTVIAVVVLWFGAVAAMCGGCGMCMGLAGDEMALQAEVRRQVATELEMQSYEVEIESYYADPPFSGDSKTITGTAVYTDETGTAMAIDFTADANKVDGEWEVSNVVFEGEPYEWIDPFADGDFSYDGEEPFDSSFDSSIEGVDGTVLDGSAIDGSAPPDDTFNRDAPPGDDPFADPES